MNGNPRRGIADEENQMPRMFRHQCGLVFGVGEDWFVRTMFHLLGLLVFPCLV